MSSASNLTNIKLKPFTYREEGNSKLVFFMDTEEIFVANDTSFFILLKIEKGLSLNQIMSLLTEEYDVTYEVAQFEVESFANKLLTLGLLKGDLK